MTFNAEEVIASTSRTSKFSLFTRHDCFLNHFDRDIYILKEMPSEEPWLVLFQNIEFHRDRQTASKPYRA